MNFADVKNVTIPEGSVKRILQGNTVLWKMPYILKVLTGTLPLTFSAVQANIAALTQFGKTVQNGTPTPDAPVWPVINNGTVMPDWQGDGISEGDGTWYRAYINVGEAYWAYYADASSSIRIPVQSGVKYRLHWDTTDSSVVGSICRLAFVKTTSTPKSGSRVNLYKADGSSGVEMSASPQDVQSFEFEVTDASIRYAVIQVSGSVAPWKDGDFSVLWAEISHMHLQTKQLSVVGTPEVLTVGDQTATVPDLYAVGDYKDEVDLVSGTVTRRVGVKVLDGTEEWVKGTTSFYVDDVITDSPTNNNFTVQCTHYMGRMGSGSAQSLANTNSVIIYFNDYRRINIFATLADYATAADFKSYIAAQYAAGTPVIILYPLSTATAEQVIAQALTTSDGTNVVDATANVTEIEATVQYYAES